MTTSQPYSYATTSDYSALPDRVIFTYTDEGALFDLNSSFNTETGDNTTLPSSPSATTSVWWMSDHPSGYSWPHIIFGAICITIIILMIIIGNFLVMWAIVHDRQLKSTQNLFIGSLAMADFLIGLVVIPFSLTNELMGYWLFGVIWCEVHKAIDVLLCTASIMSLCLISLDRYWSITRALHYARQRTRKRAAVMIFTVWFIAAVVSIPPLIGWKQETPFNLWAQCTLSEDIGYVFYSAFGSFFIPASIMVFVYFKIYQAAKKRARKNVAKAPTSVGTSGEKGRNQKRSTDSSNDPPPGIEFSVDYVDNECETKPKGGITTEDTACDTAVDSVGFTSEDDITVKAKRLSDETHQSKVEGECSNPLSTNDSNSETHQPVLNKAKLDLPALRVTHLCDAGSADHGSKAVTPASNSMGMLSGTSSVAADLSGIAEEQHNGEVKQFKIIELRSNGNSATATATVTGSQKASVITSIRKRLFKHQRDSRRKKYPVSRQDSKGPIDLQSAERNKRKLAKARERRATVVLGLVMAAFILCWLPFFSLYLASAFCPGCIPQMVFTIFFWIGYCNSALNPCIYTVFNRDFRRAFQKIIFGKRSGSRR